MLSTDAINEIVDGYRCASFLMADPQGHLAWFHSKHHALFPLAFPMPFPRSLRRVLAAGCFEYRLNGDFLGCVEGCASRPETWISDDLKQVYLALNQAGHAHSFEAWHEGELAGGIIGIAIGAAFIGESMFYRIPDASKCALVALHAHLIQSGYLIFDAQIQNPHLARFGTIEVERERYLVMLEQAVATIPVSPLAPRIVPFLGLT